VVLVALAVATFGVSLATTLPAALGTALVSWGVYTGFVLDSLGQLQLNSRSALAAVVLMLAALVAAAGVSARNYLRESRSRAAKTPVRVVRLAPPIRG
jgi:succinate-acetate transporter protein